MTDLQPKFNADPWRLSCPEGHRAIRLRRMSPQGGFCPGDNRWYCETCAEPYETVTDMKTGKEVSP